MISWRGVAKKRRKPKLGWMKLKSSGTVASKQQSWPESNHFVSNWHIAVTASRRPTIKRASQKKRAGHLRPALPLEYPQNGLVETRLG
jgi:hypothetical protein